MSGFYGELDVRLTRDDDAGDWLLLAVLGFADANGAKWEAPAGMHTDFASVPRLPLIYEAVGNTARKPGTIHDYLYSVQITTRARADALLREMMLAEGMPAWQAQAFYVAVRLFGGAHWVTRPTQSIN